MKPDWSICTILETTFTNLVANAFASIFTSDVSNEIGRYDSRLLRALPDFKSTIIIASFMERGRWPYSNAALNISNNSRNKLTLYTLYISPGNPSIPGALLLGRLAAAIWSSSKFRAFSSQLQIFLVTRWNQETVVIQPLG